MADKPIVVVFTANSNTGATAVSHLLASYDDKVRVRCVVRKKATLVELQKTFDGKDVEVVNADIMQPALLKAVFDGDVNTAFWSTPTTSNRVDLTRRFLEECIKWGVDFPVIVSMLDANTKATSFQKQFGEIEEICKKLEGTPVKKQALDRGKQVLQPIILRCASFYQNFYGSLGGIQAGTLYYPLGAADAGKLPHVDLEDIGQCIAKIMADPEPHAGKTYNLIGEYQTGNFIATAIAMGTQHSVQYEHVDDATAVMAFEALGLPGWLAEGNVEVLRYFREGNGQGISSDVESLLGRRPTTFRNFAKREIKALL